MVEGDWVHHGHHIDPRYNDVVFHLSLWRPKRKAVLRSSRGRKVMNTFLEDHLTISPQRIVQLIDLDLYPYKKFVGSGKCARRLFTKMSEQKAFHLFCSAAFGRLERKAEYLETWMEGEEYCIQGGIAQALGYKHNAQAFLELFLFLRKVQDHAADEILSISMGCCGFFEEPYWRKWEMSSTYRRLYHLWSFFSSEIDHQACLVLHKVRPLNHPVRRLVVLSRFLEDKRFDTLPERFDEVWRAHWERCDQAKALSQLKEALGEIIPVYRDEYWNRHYLFEKEPRDALLPLLGGNLKKEILVNIVLPFLYKGVCIREDVRERSAFARLFHSVSSSNTSKSRYLLHRFLGDSAKGRLFKKAAVEQGAYQIHRDYCLHYEASCEGCPFVERVAGNEGYVKPKVLSS